MTALVAAGGIFTGVLALTLILSVMNGMEAELAALLHDGEPHLRLEPTGAGGLQDLPDLLSDLEALPGVAAVAPYVESEVLLVRRVTGAPTRMQTASLRGVDPQRERALSTLLNPNFVDFQTDVEWVLPDGEEVREGLVLGVELAHNLGVGRGDIVLIVVPDMSSTQGDEGIGGREEARVVLDLFDSGLYEINATLALGGLSATARFLKVDGEAAALALSCHIPEDAAKVAEAALALSRFQNFRAETWQERNRLLFEAMAREKLLMYLFLLLTVTVASLGIVGSMTLMVSEKRGEIGILRTLGMSRRSVMSMVVLEGWVVGLGGVVLGLLAGWGLGALLMRHPLTIPWDLFIVEKIPVLMIPADFAWVAAITLLVSLAATLYPGWEAARLDPVEAIRDS
ncbi:ABC transporter permease [bacterium]|nr:ABC transporter permease [bacterium]